MSPATLRTLIWTILALDALALAAALVYWRWPRAPEGTRLRRLTMALAGFALCLAASLAGIRMLGRQERALSHYYAGIDQVKRGDLEAAEREFRESLRWDPRSKETQARLQQVTERPKAAQRQQRVQLQPAPYGGGGGAPPASQAKPPPEQKPPPKPKHPPHLPSPFAITRYALTVRLDPARHGLAATARVSLRSRKERLRRLNFSFSPEFEVQSVRQGERAARFEHRNDLLDVRLPAAVDSRQDQLLEVQYRRRASGARRPLLRGGDLISEAGSYLRSEARWYPATGELDFRAPVRIAVTVPRGYTAVSVGGLQGIEKAGDEVTFRWATERPAAMISLAAARYVGSSQVSDGVKVSTFLFARDAKRAPEYLRETARIVRFFSQQFGPYPFEKIAVTEIPRFPGGYGTTSFVMLTEASFRQKKLPVEFLAHEIAHQWWGNSVFPQGLGAGWLSEAFAEYAAFMYLESVGGPKALRAAVREAASQYLDAAARLPEEPIRETDPYDQRGAYQAVIYNKGALVLHALRYTVGDTKFRRILRQFADRHRLGRARIEDFQAVAEAVHGEPLGWFFDQWLGRVGAPKLTYRYAAEGGTAEVEVTQPEPDYRLPIDLAIESGNNVTRRRVVLEGTRHLLSVPVPGRVSSLGFDPDDWILKEPVRWETGSPTSGGG